MPGARCRGKSLPVAQSCRNMLVPSQQRDVLTRKLYRGCQLAQPIIHRPSIAHRGSTERIIVGAVDLLRHSPPLCPVSALCGPELPTPTIAHDPTGGRVGEVTADDHHLRIPETLHERLAGDCALRLVHIEVAMAQRLDKLNRMMHQVARYHCLLAP